MVNELTTQPRPTGRHYSLTSKGPSLAFDVTGRPSVDRSAMSARAVISTATVDRVGDVLIPLGCRTENYAKNPVVLWAHGMEGIGQPIATSRAPDGTLSVAITHDDVQAISWFSQSSLEATQIFELIDEGIVRATSVRETPIKSHTFRDPEMGEILIVEEWDLEEWSWCAVGINPDAVAKTLNRNRLGGRPISQSIFKSLLAVSPQYRRLGVGLPTEKNMAEDYLSNDSNMNTSDDDSSPNCDNDDADSSNQPYGSTVIAAAHTALVTACGDIEDALGPLENPTVKESLHEILAALQEQTVALEGLYSSNYPEQPELKSDDESADDDDSAMKAFLESGKVASLQVLGLGSRLRGMIGARNLTPPQRRTLTAVTQKLTRLVSQSKDQRSQAEGQKTIALQKSIQELAELVDRIKK